MVRLTEQARRLRRLQQTRAQDAAHATHLAVEYKRSKHVVEEAAVVQLDREFTSERAGREARLRGQYEAAMATLGQGHVGAQRAHKEHVEHASEQYWAFVRSQQAERHRSEAARTEATRERLKREQPRTDLVNRLRRVAEVEQDRAIVAAADGRVTAQRSAAPAATEPAASANVPSTNTHLHAVCAPVVVREERTTTAFEAARAVSDEAAALRRQTAGAEAARELVASARGKQALALLRTDQVRAQFPKRRCSVASC